MQGPAAAELELLDVGLAHRVQFLLLEGLLIGVVDELLLGLVQDFFLEPARDDLERHFARAKARELCLSLKIPGHGFKGLFHLLGVHLHAQQLFARRQILYGYIHKQTFPSIVEKVQWASSEPFCQPRRSASRRP